MPQVQAWDHGRYVIKGGYINNRALARAFVRQPRHIKGSILECSGDTVEAAMAKVAAELDRIAEEAVVGRRTDLGSGLRIPAQGEFETALRCVAIPAAVLDLLHVHAIAPSWLPALEDIARFGGMTDVATLIGAYERVSTAIAAELDLAVPPGLRLHLVLSLPDTTQPSSDATADLQPELRLALTSLLGTTSSLLDKGQMLGNL
ncbi:MAG: hypothetical protein U1A24_10705 [Cypionkella sp.]|uniref:hypothetical protein n=1 Tax=Cypionkella sp. TaxID=2811411 RepID=UPI002ABCB144|nr:hypothetical protein [Cypionkella sp.]MDZ4311009.1 hypothetical protein [Cypionkella sp.]